MPMTKKLKPIMLYKDGVGKPLAITTAKRNWLISGSNKNLFYI
jgi:hypothetical protein